MIDRTLEALIPVLSHRCDLENFTLAFSLKLRDYLLSKYKVQGTNERTTGVFISPRPSTRLLTQNKISCFLAMHK